MDGKHDQEFDILVKFNYDDGEYVIVTDNTYDNEGNINVYGAKLDGEERLEEVFDDEVKDIFDMMIEEYRQKILRGDI